MELTIFLIGLGIGYLIGKFYKPKENSGFNEEQEIKARENMEKIMEMFKTKSEIRNDEIESALGVSDRTVTRYMDQLEKEGKVIQVGTTGRSVTYKPK